MHKTDWIYIPKPLTEATARLFCFPYAGGGPSTFHQWPQAFDAQNVPLEIGSVSLPGHEFRIAEPAISNLAKLIPRLAQEMEPHFNRPFYFFGYSVGALIAFELVRFLRSQKAPQPRHLFVCAKGAPHLPLPFPPIHDLPDPELIQELKRFDGTSKEVLENQQLMELFLPCLRADFSLNETYEHEEEAPLECPITAFVGLDDREAGPNLMQPWAQHTNGPFQIREFPGGHFFVPDQLEGIVSEVKAVINKDSGEL